MLSIIQDALPTVALVSVLTMLLTEGFKSIFKSFGASYVPQIIALIDAIVLTVFVCLVESTYYGIPMDSQFWCKTATVGLLSLLCATHGYDYVVSAISCIREL